MQHRTLGSVAIALGLVACVLSALATPHVLTTYVVLDGELTRPWAAYAMQALGIAVGSALIALGVRRRRRSGGIERRRLLLGLAAAALSLVFVLGVAELALRLVAPLRPHLVLRGDTAWEYLFRISHPPRPDGTIELGREDRFDPLLGWLPSPSRNEDGEPLTNAGGMRAAREYAEARVPGLRRVVVVGDSYAWGDGVKTSETFSSVLEQLLPDAEVINLGVHGWGTDQQVLYLRERGVRFSPDLVVLSFFEDNFIRNLLSFRDYAKPRFELQDGRLELRGVPLPTPEELLARPMRMPRSVLLELVRTDVLELLGKTKLTPLEARPEWHLFAGILDAAHSEASSVGARLLVLFIPWDVRARPYASENAIAAWARRTGVSFLSTRAAFAALPPEDWPKVYRGHWTPFGHRVAAEAMREHIDREGLLPAVAPAGANLR